MKSLNLVFLFLAAGTTLGASAAETSTQSKRLGVKVPMMAANGNIVYRSSITEPKIKRKKIAKKVEEKKDTQGARLTGKLGVTQDMPIQAVGNWTHVGASLDYNFHNSYSLGVATSYSKPYGEPDPYYDGFGDLGISLSDSKLVSLEDRGFNIAAAFGYVLPMSRSSKNATLVDGFKVGLSTSQMFAGTWSIAYDTAIARYFHQYDADPTGATYNKPYDWNNELTLSNKITDKVTWAFTAGIGTSLSYTAPTDENATEASDNYRRESKHLMATGLSWKTLSNLTVRANVRSTRSEYAKYSLFDAATTMFRLGATLSF